MPKTIEQRVEEFESKFAGGKCVEVGTEKGKLHALQCIRQGVCVCKVEDWLRNTLQEVHTQAVEEDRAMIIQQMNFHSPLTILM